jgi:hypothetical protein
MGRMAGYSGTPLPQKVGLKAGTRFGVVKPPADFGRTLGELPPGVAARPVAAGKYDVIVCFAPTMAEVARRIPELKRRLDPAGGLWMAVCAIDHVWSGLRFVYRVADRPKGTGR